MRLLTLAALALTAHALTRRQVDQPPVYVEGTCTIVWGDRDAKRVMRNAESFAKKGQVVTAQRLYQAILNAGDRVNDRLRIKAAKAKGDLHKRQRKAAEAKRAAEQEKRVLAQIKKQLDSLPPAPTTPVDHEKIRRVREREQRAEAKRKREAAERERLEKARTEANERKAKAAEAPAASRRELRDLGSRYESCYPDYEPKKRGFAKFWKSLWRRLRGKNDDDVDVVYHTGRGRDI